MSEEMKNDEFENLLKAEEEKLQNAAANPTSTFKHRIKDLLTEYQEVASLNAMGFQPDWMNEKMWNDKK